MGATLTEELLQMPDLVPSDQAPADVTGTKK